MKSIIPGISIAIIGFGLIVSGKNSSDHATNTSHTFYGWVLLVVGIINIIFAIISGK